MTGKNEYIDEAYKTLLELSSDEQKRLEYEAREKALRDYNSHISYAHREGEQIGEERGIVIGEKRGIAKLIMKWGAEGRTVSEIAALLDISEDEVLQIQAKDN